MKKYHYNLSLSIIFTSAISIRLALKSYFSTNSIDCLLIALIPIISIFLAILKAHNPKYIVDSNILELFLNVMLIITKSKVIFIGYKCLSWLATVQSDKELSIYTCIAIASFFQLIFYNKILKINYDIKTTITVK